MTARRRYNLGTSRMPIGRARLDLHVGVVGWKVEGPMWAGDSEERVANPRPVLLQQHTTGWTLRLVDGPAIALNDGDLVALGVALIQAATR